MKLALCGQMRSLDAAAVAEYGIPGIVLMENAAVSVFEHCKKLEAYAAKKVAIFCGTGNNGGDGFAIARHMHNDGAEVLIVLVGDSDKIKGDARINYEICVKMKMDIRKELPLGGYPLVIEAILGTGFSGELSEPVQAAIEAINSCGGFIVSVDCPAGGNPDTGGVSGKCVKAGLTVTLALAKPGLLLYPLAEYAGRLEIGAISAPAALLETDTGMYSLERASAAALLPGRRARSHKGTYGRAVIAAGSAGMAGAAAFCAKAAYKAGCGYVDLCVPEGIIPVIQQLAPQAVATALPERDGHLYGGSAERCLERINAATVCLIGPGLSSAPGVAEFVKIIIKRAETPLIIDADALNVISPELLKTAAVPPIVTPHPLEMSRLQGRGVAEILSDSMGIAREFAESFNAVVVLKDAATVIADWERLYINRGACSALAKAGSGDILAGIMAGLTAQGLRGAEAAALAVFIHSESGRAAARKYGEYSVSCDDIINGMSEVLAEIQKESGV